MRRALLSLLLAVATTFSAGVAALPASAHEGGGDDEAMWYLALGDSLSTGVQPLPTDIDTNQGYVDQLFAFEKSLHPNLRLKKLGCGAVETTTSFIAGGVCPTYGAGGSQLKSALRFLRRHRDQVAFVTLDIGGNDISPCLRKPTPLEIVQCDVAAQATIDHNLALITGRLRDAGGDDLPMIGMTYYNVVLASWFLGAPGIAFINFIEPYNDQLNQHLRDSYGAEGWGVADVAESFRSHDFTPTPGPPAGIPVNTALICLWTYMCVAGDIHANPTGYGVIAATFESVLVL